MSPEMLGGYELLEVAGKGGTAIVWKARSPEGRIVALPLGETTPGLGEGA